MKKNFFEVLSKFNALEKVNKQLRKEDPKSFEVFLKFMLTIEGNFHYAEKNEYINLARNFINAQITADDFSSSFLAIYEGINEKINQMRKKESLELANFINETNQFELVTLLAKTYGSCDSFLLELESLSSNEIELKNYAQILLSQLEQE